MAEKEWKGKEKEGEKEIGMIKRVKALRMSFIFLVRFPVGNGMIPAVKEQFPIEINKESRKYLSKFPSFL